MNNKKGKITIEIEDSQPVIFDLDNIEFYIEQSIYSFYDYGDYVAKESCPGGEIRMSIRGIRKEVRDRFNDLRVKYPICIASKNLDLKLF